MSYDANKVIQIAEAEIGYLEKKTNAKLDDKTANAGNKNYTKYARDLDALGFYNGRKNGFAWCDIFVDWCFVRAYGLEAALKLTNQPLGKANCGAGCRYSRNYYKKAKRLFDAPQPGDQIFFWPKDAIGGPAVAHTGLVYRVDGTYVYTIEGNTSGANGVVANGGGVCKKKYRLTYNRIAGYGRPDWGVEAADAPAADPAAPKARHILVKANSVNLRAGDGVKYANNASASIRPERPSKPDQARGQRRFRRRSCPFRKPAGEENPPLSERRMCGRRSAHSGASAAWIPGYSFRGRPLPGACPRPAWRVRG